MMNCYSPAFKTTAFYKFDSSNEKLLIRPMKKKWKDFCKDNLQNESDIRCSFKKPNIIRSSIIKKKDNYLEKIYDINFKEYSLIETIKIFKNKNLKEKSENIHKCRKIKI